MKHQISAIFVFIFNVHVHFFTVWLIIRFLKLMSHLLQIFFVWQTAKLFSLGGDLKVPSISHVEWVLRFCAPQSLRNNKQESVSSSFVHDLRIRNSASSAVLSTYLVSVTLLEKPAYNQQYSVHALSHEDPL